MAAKMVCVCVCVWMKTGVRDVNEKTAECLQCVWSVARWSVLRAIAVRLKSMV